MGEKEREEKRGRRRQIGEEKRKSEDGRKRGTGKRGTGIRRRGEGVIGQVG